MRPAAADPPARGGGSSDYLNGVAPQIEAAFRDGRLPAMAVVTPDAERSFYLDYADGSQRWETFIVDEFLTPLRATLPVAGTAETPLLAGVSMGGHGTCRIGLRYPDRFRAVAAMEPAVMPALDFADVPSENLEFQGADVLAERYGSPPDAYWNANNPARIAGENAGAIIDSGIRIYLEVGDEDFLRLNDGTEFLHRALLDAGIKHEYRLVLGGNHVGRTLAPRFDDVLGFMARALENPVPDPVVAQILDMRRRSR